MASRHPNSQLPGHLLGAISKHGRADWLLGLGREASRSVDEMVTAAAHEHINLAYSSALTAQEIGFCRLVRPLCVVCRKKQLLDLDRVKAEKLSDA